jgi:hypothetical protein
MPDEKPDVNSLADLISEAELAPPEQSPSNLAVNEAAVRQLSDPETPPSTIDDVSACSHEGTFPHQRAFCRQCKRLICPQCCSALDSMYCVTCLSRIDLKNEVQTVPDDDGIMHNVTHIQVTPAYNTIRWIPEGKTTAKALADMDESELFEFVRAYKDAVREAERALDFRRIRLGSAQLELDERREQTRRKLRADKTKFPIKTVTVDSTGKKVTKTANAGQMMEMLKMLQALKASKAAKANEKK